ncbi:hypothetical protein [Streptomyces sp. RerS4]|uniref:hypothetical protein n=1 Tax=Streptomyces sp. RerS4 TaxID=2942449 RepID=UPI00201C7EA9|nr:hypothetical protein [Streptomyces sp. RerS4]UQX03128.1 hypothetical protein M4D82_23500 [Streptomyces sp. RerS4]
MDTKKSLAPTAPEADAVEDASTAVPPTADETTATDAPAEAAASEATDAPADATDGDEATDGDDDFDDLTDEAPAQGSDVGSGAAAIVAAGLGLVALSGTWVSRVIAERQTLIGQIESVSATTAKEKIAALYGDAWHMTALVNGVVATVALLIAAFVLARPAFGAPGRVLPTWVRAVSWAGVALGLIGVLLFGFMYFDLLVPLPTAAE